MKSKVFTKLIASYSIVLLIPIILTGILIYGKFVNIMTEELINSTGSMLYQIKDVIDIRLIELNNISTQVSTNSKINLLMSSSNNAANSIYPFFVNGISELKNYRAGNEMIYDIFLAFRSSDIVVGDKSKYNFNYLFDKSYSFERINKEQLYKQMNELQKITILPAQQVNNQGTITSAIIYMRPIPVDSIKPRATLLITIKEDIFQGMIKNVLGKYYGSVYMLDSEGIIISSTKVGKYSIDDNTLNEFIDSVKMTGDNKLSVIKKDFIITYVKSTNTAWSYIAVIPSGQILGKVDYVKLVSVIFIFVSLIIGLFLVYIFSHNNYRNVKKIADTILLYKRNKPESMYKNEWELINHTISNFIKENESLQQRLTDQMPVLRNLFYTRLLMGDFDSKEDIASLMNFLGLNIEHSRFAVILLAFDNYKNFSSFRLESEQGMIRLALSNAAEERCSRLGSKYIVEMSKDRIAIIIGLDKTGKEALPLLKEAGEKIRSFVNNNFDFTITIGISNIKDTLISIKDAYAEACKAVDYRMLKGENNVIGFCEERNSETYRNYYSLKQDNQIINYLRAGDYDSIKNILEDIVSSIKCNAGSLNSVKYTCMEMVNTAVRASEELGVDNTVVEQNLPSLFEQETLDGVCREVCKFYLYLCDMIKNAKSNKSLELMKRLLNYIEKNYTNELISVETLADEFSVSSSYISHYFKEKAGCGIIDYLHGTRLTKAKELLLSTDKTISEISNAVGYSSMNNFLRVFKRYERITPTNYRTAEMLKSSYSYKKS